MKTCPECGKNTSKRLLGTGAGILFKGSGFHETDYRSDAYKKAEKKDKDGGATKTDSGKTETKKDTSAKNAKSTPKPQSGSTSSGD